MALSNCLTTASPQSLVFGSIVLLASALFLHSIVRAVFSPLRSVPGPFLARFSRLWYFRKACRYDFEKTNIELHRKYGPVVRIAPDNYSIDDPAAIKPIYGHGTAFTKAPWYDATSNPNQNFHDLFSERDPKKHAALRRAVAALYSMTALLKMEEAVNECITLIDARFREIARSGHVIDLQYWLQCYAFDVIGAITIAKRFGFLDAGKDNLNVFPSLNAYLEYLTRVGAYPELHKPLSKLATLLGQSGLAKMVRFTSVQIQERIDANRGREKKPKEEDFLGKLLRLHEEEPRTFTMDHVRTTCGTNIGAGSDTTSISLSGIMWGLIKNPEAMKKLRAEIDEKATSGEISDPVTFAEAQNMPYLQAVIQEGLRRHPATGLPLSRVVPKGGAEIAGRFFPEGAVVGINTWVAHANKDVFGDDAEQFRPERWLAEKERTQMMERYFLPFGHGSRTCIGKNISLMEISKLIPYLVRKFDFELADPNMKLQTHNVWFVKQKNFHVRINERRT